MPIDPCFADLLSDPRNIVRPPPAHVSLKTVRRAADAAMAIGDAPRMASETDDAVRVGARTIPVRHFRPTDDATLPAILFCHGGGFVWGSIETHAGISRRLAAQTGAVVLSVGYGLAPETRLAEAVHQAYAALRDMLAGAVDHGIDPNAIALCGDSAGGAICVGVAALAARDGIGLRHLALFYPALDPTCTTESQRDLAQGPILTQAAMRWFWDCALGDADRVPTDLMALHTPHLERFPPTTLATAEYDPLRDEAASFANRLMACGIDAQLTCYPGMVHGFFSLAVSSPTIDAALLDTCQRLRKSLLPSEI